MATNNSLPPVPTNAVLKRIYPWDEYNKTLVIQWLYAQAQATGFHGTLEDFKLRYGAYVEAADPQEIYDLIDEYTGTYHITPLVGIEQILHTKNKVLNADMIIDPIPESITGSYRTYKGDYQITPLPYTDQVLRTEDKILKENIVINEIPIHQVDNDAGGRTITIG